MPELRKDPIVGRWVIISTERGRRPTDFELVEAPRAEEGFCPFCPGNEVKTPPEVYADRPIGSPPNGPGWRVRVVSNKFPALQIEGELDRRAEGIYDKMNGVGAHEVIIETTEHSLEMSDQPIDQLERVFHACRERIVDLARDKRFRYIQVFKNDGAVAGASLEHSHMQLIATPIVPRRVMEELEGCAQHFRMKERCIYCDIVHQEIAFEKRIVSANSEYLAIAPFASRFPFETWILPRQHVLSFEESYDSGSRPFVEILKEVLNRMNVALHRPPYNFVLHTSPCNDWKEPLHYHWHLELMPKLTRVAGFEWGTGFYINPTPPEESAACLREVRLAPEGTEAPGPPAEKVLPDA